MQAFTDTGGRVWEVVIHVSALKRVRGRLGVDLYGLVNKRFEGLGELLGDPVALVDVLYVLCLDQAEQLGVSDVEFGSSLGGDSYDAAVEAFLAEYIAFFPKEQRGPLERMVAAGRKLAARSLKEVGLRLDRAEMTLNGEEGGIDEFLRSLRNAPESSESIPDRLL